MASRPGADLADDVEPAHPDFAARESARDPAAVVAERPRRILRVAEVPQDRAVALPFREPLVQPGAAGLTLGDVSRRALEARLRERPGCEAGELRQLRTIAARHGRTLPDARPRARRAASEGPGTSATRTAPGDIPRSDATSWIARSSIAVCRKASNVRLSNSDRMFSSALTRTRDRTSRSVASAGALRDARGRGVLDARPRGRATDALRLAGRVPEVVADLVHRHDVQPSAEGVLGPRLAEPIDSRRDGAEDLLHDVGGVRWLERGAMAPVLDERRVEVDQAIPGRAIAFPEPVDQAPGSGRAGLFVRDHRGLCWSLQRSHRV